MTEHFSFFDPVLKDGLPDRDYNAQQFTDYFGALVTTGLMKGAANELAVATSGSNMVTTIDTGIAFVEAKQYINTDLLAHTLDTESLGKSRIDRIVIRMDLSTNARHVKSFVKKGVASAAPVAPVLTQTPNVYEISLAQIKVIGGQTFINKVDVTDERGKDVICPWAGSNILPNFDDSALAELIANQLTDGPNAKAYGGGLNDLTKSGFYSVESPTGFPVGFPGTAIIQVITTNNGLNTIQLYYYVNNNVGLSVFRRVKAQNAWGVWKRLDTLLNDTLTSTSTTEAATANAVKMLNDKLVSAHVVLGSNASNSGISGVAIGENSKSLGNNTIAIGKDATAGAAGLLGAVALGNNANATAAYAYAIGSGAYATNLDAGVLGRPQSKWVVPGTFSVTGTKNFEMPHPAPHKRDTHVIRHGAVESPTAGDTLYRYTIQALTDGETVELQLPDYFEHLNKDVDVWINADKHFAHAFGDVVGDILKVTCEKAGTYNALVIGTRNDDHDSVQTWDIKGVEREIGESWTGETHSFEVDEITEVTEFEEVFQ